MLCTRLRLKTPPPGTSAAVRYTCNHDQQGVQPRGFSGRWGLQPGFHLSAEEILQSCNMKSYSHVTLQKKKKQQQKSETQKRLQTPKQNQRSPRQRTTWQERSAGKRDRPCRFVIVLSAQRVPSAFSPLLLNANNRHLFSVAFFKQYVGQSSCLQIYAFSLCVKENLP